MFHKFSTKELARGFTLVELLIVIGLIAVLATVVVVVLNPAEFLARGRDAKRNSDIDTLDKALSIYDLQSADYTGITANTIYISLPDDVADTCPSHTANLPALPPGGTPPWRYKCATSANYRSTTGSGWIPLNFSTVSSLSLAALPIDPTNTATNQLYYTYIKGSWNLTAKMESRKLMQTLSSIDTGNDPARYEKGSNMNLWSQASGLVAYWKLDETSGTTAVDSSGNGNNSSSFVGSPTLGATGKVGTSYKFTANAQYASSPSIAPNGSSSHTIAFWVRMDDLSAPGAGNAKGIIMKGTTDDSYGFDIQSTTPALRYGIRDLTNTGKAVNYNIDTWSINDWHHVAGVYKVDDKVELYIDGSSVGSTTLGTFNKTEISTNIMDIGSVGSVLTGNTADPRFRGSVDDIRLYGRSLSASEVTALYNATR